MCELTEVPYMPGDVVWVKLGPCWWPGEVKDMNTLPEDLVAALRKKPLAVVKFFGEDTYEYVKNLDNIYHYNNRRKMEFIKKGMDLTRAKSKQGSNFMDKFPTDVVTAESLTKGDVNILSTVAFVPEDRPQYKDLFGDPKKKSPKKSAVGRPSLESKFGVDRKSVQSIIGKVKPLIELKHRITHPRFIKESDHEVRIRQQPNSSPKVDVVEPSYKCQQCEFSTSRQNVFILHCKAHRDNIIQPSSANKNGGYSQSKVRRTPKSILNVSSKSTKSSPSLSTNSPKEKKPTTTTTPRKNIFQNKKAPKKGSKVEQNTTAPLKTAEGKEKDMEKRNKILADWDEEDEEEEEKEIKKLKLELGQKEEAAKCEKEIAVDKFLDTKTSIMPKEKVSTVSDIPSVTAPTSDPSSVYDLIDDADDFIPPPRLSETKRATIIEPPAIPTESDDTRALDKEFAALMQETSVPELPQVPAALNLQTQKSELIKKDNIPLTNAAIKTTPQILPKKVEEVKQTTVSNNSMPLKHQTDTADETSEENSSNMNTAVDTVQTSIFSIPTLNTLTSTTANQSDNVLGSDTDTQVVQQQSSEVILDPSAETATYVLVTIDDSGGFQQFQTLEGMGNTTLLAYDTSHVEEGGTRTIYIDPSQLSGTGASLENLFLAIDAPDGSGPSMVQIQPNQVIQVSGDNVNSVMAEDDIGKSKQDILAVALANTQVLQSTGMDSHVMTQDAVVKVTNAAQSPVMTPRVVDSQSTPKFLVSAQNASDRASTAVIAHSDKGKNN